MTRTFVDAGVLIFGGRGSDPYGSLALTLLSDPEREYASSPYVALEVLPKASYHGKTDEAAFYGTFFASIALMAQANETILADAQHYGQKYGLGAMDALHIAAAIQIGAEEFLTTERLSSPIYRVQELRVVQLQAFLRKPE